MISKVLDGDAGDIASVEHLDTYSGKTLLLTGVSGMLGAYTAAVLTGAFRMRGVSPKRLHVFGRSPDRLFRMLGDTPEWLRWSADYATVTSAAKTANVIYHFASPSSVNNVRGSLASLGEANERLTSTLVTESSSELQAFYFASSSEVYGQGASRVVSESTPMPHTYIERGQYPAAKAQAERRLLDTAWLPGQKLRILRIFHTFGPGLREEDSRSFADVLWSAAHRRPVVLHSAGDTRRTFLYALDFVRALILLQASEATDPIVNVGGVEELSIREFADLAMTVSGLRDQVQRGGVPVGYTPSPTDRIVPDVSLLTSYGWIPEVSVVEAIRRTVAWMRESERSRR